jgi:hypothetical protein
MRFLSGLRATLLLGIFTGLVAAQQQFPFLLRVASTTTAGTVANGSTIGFSAAVGQSQAVRLTATYVGIGKVTVPQSPELFGSPEFTPTLAGTPPIALNSGESVIIDLQFLPTASAQANAQLVLPFTETISTTNPPIVSQNQITLNLQGTAPAFVLSYVLQTDLNVVPLQPGGTIPYPDTVINTTSQANLNITNTGSATGTINDVTLSGSPAFTLLGKPLLPGSVTAGQQLALNLRYQPTVVGTDSAQVQITYSSGPPVTVNLLGHGVASTYTYNLLQGDQVTTVAPPGPISLPDANVGDKSSVVIQVKNNGNATGTITNPPALAGTAFQITNGPVFPQVLKPNDSFTFTLNFSPTQPGAQTGQLLVGSDLFSLTGQGLGPQLNYSYVSGGTTTTLTGNAALVFSPIAVGQTSQLTFMVMNSGTTAAKISNIVIGESKSPFSVTALPPNLPTSLDPGQSLQFNVNFTPTTVGPVTGTLHIDTTTISVIGSATPPPPLPTYTIQGPSGNVSAGSQPTIRLKLANPYPLALIGVLTLSTSGNGITDPAVKFSTGNQQVGFVIPANATDANFANQGPVLALQTGTVATTITLTPSFATQDGGVDVTPGSPTTLQFTVAPAAPVLVAIVPSSETTSSFTLNVTGYSTTRTLTSVTLQFTAAAATTVGTTQVTIDLRQAATQWFQSSGSQTFGGAFTVALPFTLHGTPPTGETLLQTIASVSATVSNEQGASNTLVATLP